MEKKLPAEVAAHYELLGHSTRFYVPRLGREVDLTTLTMAEAAELVALPGGFEWLKKREVAPPEPAVTPPPARRKRAPRAAKNEGTEGT